MVRGIDRRTVESAGSRTDQRGLWDRDRPAEGIRTALGGIWKTLRHAPDGRVDGQRHGSVPGSVVERGPALLPIPASRFCHTREVCNKDDLRGAASGWNMASGICALHRERWQQLLVEHLARTERKRRG